MTVYRCVKVTRRIFRKNDCSGTIIIFKTSYGWKLRTARYLLRKEIAPTKPVSHFFISGKYSQNRFPFPVERRLAGMHAIEIRMGVCSDWHKQWDLWRTKTLCAFSKANEINNHLNEVAQLPNFSIAWKACLTKGYVDDNMPTEGGIWLKCNNNSFDGRLKFIRYKQAT